MTKCEATITVLGTNDEPVVVQCHLDEGHERPFHRECSCGRHNEEELSLGKSHQATVMWGSPDPLPELEGQGQK